MKKIIVGFFYMILLQNSFSQYTPAAYPVYEGNDLGLTYRPSASAFRIWSPSATAAELICYANDTATSPSRVVQMEKSRKGTWYTKPGGDLKGMFYTFRVLINGAWSEEVVDPYARAVGTNGKRAVVIELLDTDPVGWEKHNIPSFSNANVPPDAIIYELHIRDATIHPTSGVINKGKFLGLGEESTSFDGTTTGLQHLKELGVTHVHLLPFYDYNSVDESNPR